MCGCGCEEVEVDKYLWIVRDGVSPLSELLHPERPPSQSRNQTILLDVDAPGSDSEYLYIRRR